MNVFDTSVLVDVVPGSEPGPYLGLGWNREPGSRRCCCFYWTTRGRGSRTLDFRATLSGTGEEAHLALWEGVATELQWRFGPIGFLQGSDGEPGELDRTQVWVFLCSRPTLRQRTICSV